LLLFYSPRDKLALIKAYKLIEVLELDYEQAIEFFTMYKEIEEERKNYVDNKNKLVQELQQEVKKDNPSSEVIGEKIDEIFTEENTMLMNQQKQYENMNDVLDSEQMGKMIIFEDKFDDEMLRIIKDMRHKDDKKKDHKKKDEFMAPLTEDE